MQSSNCNKKEEEDEPDIIILDDIDPLAGCGEEPQLKIVRESLPATQEQQEVTAKANKRSKIKIIKTPKIQQTHQMKLPKLTPAQFEQFQTGKTKKTVPIFRCKVCKSSYDEMSKKEPNTNQVKLPDVCTNCKTLKDLKSYIPNHTITTRDFIFKCAVCSTIFTNLSVFRKHQKTHKEYSTSGIKFL